jgi:hypothetical protein
MSFTLRSSLFSRSSCAIRRASAVDVPGRRPGSISARFTQCRSDSAPTPSSFATRVIVPCFSPVSSRISSTIRTARSRSSSGYFYGLRRAPVEVMLHHPRFQGQEHTPIPVRFSRGSTERRRSTPAAS